MGKKRITIDLKKGDWIVHSFHGVGQIKGIDIRTLEKHKHIFYRVKTSKLTYWLPVDGVGKEHIRPLSSVYKINQMIKEIKKPPEDTKIDHNLMKKRINEVIESADIIEKARLVRDLHARSLIRKLNINEERILNRLKDQIVNEIKVVKNVDKSKGELLIIKYLKESMSGQKQS
jgi:RNA polymerase-interacting CarD/CdnL/TRCF family regulator